MRQRDIHIEALQRIVKESRDAHGYCRTCDCAANDPHDADCLVAIAQEALAWAPLVTLVP